ncbi:TetR/AcrR family transcriptional regulator [Bacillus suaedae]|uniref:TetR/AcrR family transcriptional regulator n=1 Tax=Halalkalibacter suaedae TaxID=2822140 RepID=A0A940WYM9_9BACI|nr:TetR/AcrR family transcriptional regulator [Bacillus suaedae]MBP3953178.1 TetR/AcrR family transcriptional regulator [Bacillus suaedae]
MIKQNKRDKIIEAALQIFLKEGYERATMQGIASAAGVGKGTTYEYFPSKEALFNDVVREGFDYLITELAVALEQEGTIQEKVERMYLRHLTIFQTETQFRDLMLNDMGKIPEETQLWLIAQQSEFVLKLKGILEDGIKIGELRPIHTRVAANTITHGLKMIYYYQGEEHESIEELVKEQVAMLFNGMNQI